MAAEESIAQLGPQQHVEANGFSKTTAAQVVEMPPSPATEATAASATENAEPAVEQQVLPDMVLRNNDEYMVVYRAIEALKSQLERARSDIEILSRLRERVLDQPQEYVKGLIGGTEPKAPGLQAIVKIPTVYVDPYVAVAASDVVDAYMQVVRIQSEKEGARLTSHISSLSKQANPALRLNSTSNGHAPTAFTKLAKPIANSKHLLKSVSPAPASATTAGLLTGNTAVATPEQSPRRVHSTTARTTAPPPLPPTPLTAINVAAHMGSVASGAPLMGRANTEPALRQVAASAPGTPSSRGKSQKTLTPQILEEFRRQASRERSQSPARSEKDTRGSSDEYDEEDEYYNKLVQSAVESDGTQNSHQRHHTTPINSVVGGLSQREHQQQQWIPSNSFIFNGATGYAQQQTAERDSTAGSHRSNTASNKRSRGKSNGGAASNSRKKSTRRSTADDPDKPKPASYNIPWSDAEQERLEQLLIEYPDEEVANDRWRKIAQALGTRNMRQVASRVQKYFIKLAKAGLPIPGKPPNTVNWPPANRSRPVATPKSDGAKRTAAAAGGSRRAAANTKRRKYVDFTSSSEDDDMEDNNGHVGALGSDEEIDLGSGFQEPTVGTSSMAGGVSVPYDRKGKQADRSGASAYEFSTTQPNDPVFHQTSNNSSGHELL
ncbi:hypothetical protein GGI07_000508 [Coemansia sp. Benny D115]|nr:hypothetical protein GGI07_000508 [Coemansia sp. Benny D115]